MALVNTYGKTDRLFMTHTGNTMGITKSGPAKQDTFISLDDTLTSALGVPPSTDPLTYAGTTDDWNLFGSWARLESIDSAVPDTAVVDYAILIWMTSTSATLTVEVVDANPPVFTTPDGVEHTVEKNPAWDAVENTVLTRAQDVTDIVVALPSQGFGDYSVSKVPNAGPPSGGGGWGLVVVYKDSSYDYTNVSVYVGSVKNGSSTSVEGFYTPPTGDVKARVFALGAFGDTSLVGDKLTLNGSALSGPRNLPNNFFTSQVCDYKGELAVIGSFGNLNGTPGQLVPKVRSGIDITNVDGSGKVGNGLSSATVGVAGSTDIVILGSFGLQINANSANLQLDKSSSQSAIGKGGVIGYTLTITNAGSSDAVNNILKDVIDTNLTVSNLKIDGSDASGDLSNLSLPDIPAGSSVAVTFDATVSESAPSADITNQYTVDYSFESIPGQPLIDESAQSNISTISVVDIKASCDKSVDLTSASPGDEITYTMTLSNGGDTPFENIILVDVISTNASYVAGSLTVNGTNTPGDLNSGANIGTLDAGSSDTIVFKVTVNDETNLNSNKIVNKATFNFDVVLGASSMPLSIDTNEVETTLNLSAELSLVKSVDKLYVDLGDAIGYSIDITNSGNVSANSVILTDVIPQGTTYVSDSLTVDGALASGDLNTGVNIGNVSPGATVNVKFEVNVDLETDALEIVNSSSITYNYTTDPENPNGESGSASSNEVTTTVSYASLDAQKSVNAEYVKNDEVFTYTIICTNSGVADATNVTIMDTIDPTIDFVPSSVVIDGVSMPSLNPLKIGIDTISPNQSVTVSFDVKTSAVPTKTDINNIASVEYSYVVDPSNPDVITKSFETNEVMVFIRYSDIKIEKTSDIPVAVASSIITYTISVINNGNVVCENIVLKDQIPEHTEFVQGSLQINGAGSPGDISAGVTIENLDPGQTIVATFQVKVISI